VEAVHDDANHLGDIWAPIFEARDKSTQQALLWKALAPSKVAVDAPSCILVDDLIEIFLDAKVFPSLRPSNCHIIQLLEWALQCKAMRFPKNMFIDIDGYYELGYPQHPLVPWLSSCS
jgi:hypothetical protein